MLLRGVWADGNNVVAIKLQPNNIPATQAWVSDELYSDHKGGVNGLFCDGSVHFIAETIDLAVLYAICTRASEEPIPANSF
jgi:prepilin-type processing-associated H-X9-DG protein